MLSSEPDIPDLASSPRRAISATCCSPCAAMAHIGLRDSVLADPVERSAARVVAAPRRSRRIRRPVLSARSRNQSSARTIIKKGLRNDAVLLCRVDVFPLQVVRQRKSWPEKDQRVTEWFTPAEAAELVHEPELSELIKAFEAMISRGG
jgi:hypothetical protein